MDRSQRVDARGLSCPQPVILTNVAMKKVPSGTIEVLVDSGTSRDNVSRFARTSGWAVTVETEPQGNFRIVLKK